LIQTLHAFVTARSLTSDKVTGQPKLGAPIPAAIDARRPYSIKVSGGIPFLPREGFTFVSDGREFRLLTRIKGKPTLVIGPASTELRSISPDQVVVPRPLLAALLWQEGDVQKNLTPSRVASGEKYTVEIAVKAAADSTRSLKVQFDPTAGVVSSISAYDGAGRLISETTYTEWKPVDLPPSGGTAGCFPRRIDLKQPSQQYEAHIRVMSITLNPKIERSEFSLPPPSGVTVQHINPSARSDK
jgi:outer membrane lipoprotein-sorting protein